MERRKKCNDFTSLLHCWDGDEINLSYSYSAIIISDDEQKPQRVSRERNDKLS